MTPSSKIKIQNLYYLLSYAFQVLRESTYKHVGTESFEKSADLCAAILISGVSFQVKQGLHREYVSFTEDLSTVRGQIQMSESLISSRLEKKIVCSYDDYSVDNVFNQIIKATFLLLLSSDIDKERKVSIRKILVYFSEVHSIELRTINWNFQYNKYNRNYQMLIAICFLVYKGLLQTTSEGSAYLMDFIDEQLMSHLYEKFLLEYYKYHWGGQLKVYSPEIKWQLDVDEDVAQLPKMQSDVVICDSQNNYLIIDAKYYEENMQARFDKKTVRSSNIYQIFTYVTNKDEELKKSGSNYSVSGLILYAMTDDVVQPNMKTSMGGKSIAAHTLDLNTDWAVIQGQLDNVIKEYFGLSK